MKILGLVRGVNATGSRGHFVAQLGFKPKPGLYLYIYIFLLLCLEDVHEQKKSCVTKRKGSRLLDQEGFIEEVTFEL